MKLKRFTVKVSMTAEGADKDAVLIKLSQLLRAVVRKEVAALNDGPELEIAVEEIAEEDSNES